MHKEMIICVILAILIIIGDIITQNYTKNTVNYITGELENLKQSLLEKSNEKANVEIDKIDNKWNEVYDKLAYYIEHDELEKVDTAIVDAKSFVETEDYPSAVAEIDKAKFVMEHIKRKYAFNLQNIF